MRKYNNIAITIIIVIFALLTFGACGQADDKTPRSRYDIKATLRGHTLAVDECIHYVYNGSGRSDSITLVSHVGAYTKSGDLAERSSPLAYPFGVNYADLDITSISIDGEFVPFAVEDAMYIDIHLPKKMHRGSRVDIDIEYTETLPKNRLRYGYNETSINLGNAFIRVLPDASPHYSYSTNGDPFYNDIADFDVTLVADTLYDVAMTGRYESQQEGKYTRYVSKAKNVRDFAIVLSDKMHVVSDICGSTVIIYMTEMDAHLVNVRLVRDVLDIFGRIYCKYPYESITVVENDFLEGGMEYPGLVYVNKSLVGAELERTIVHELAHEWWYGIVGVNENVDYFVDEGMAELSTYIYYLEHDEAEYANALMKRMHDAYVYYDARYGDNAVIGTPLSEIGDRDYYVAAYLKAPLILKDIMDKLGKRQFYLTLMGIVNRYAYNNITMDEFLKEFGRVGTDMMPYISGKSLE